MKKKGGGDGGLNGAREGGRKMRKMGREEGEKRGERKEGGIEERRRERKKRRGKMEEGGGRREERGESKKSGRTMTAPNVMMLDRLAKKMSRVEASDWERRPRKKSAKSDGNHQGSLRLKKWE